MCVRNAWKLIGFGSLALFGILFAQDSGSAEGGLKPPRESGKGLPAKPERRVEFATDEGTWMSVDVSPDGRTILFDLAGHLYTVPVEGGSAKAITSGLEFDSQPRYAPNG